MTAPPTAAAGGRGRSEEVRGRGMFLPHCPWTNGMAERLDRTLAAEWAYARPYTSNHDRAQVLPTWLDQHNLERPQTGIGGLRPIDCVNNVPGQYA